jgi:sugar/nucleoside kinase (ribokinase family)
VIITKVRRRRSAFIWQKSYQFIGQAEHFQDSTGAGDAFAAAYVAAILSGQDNPTAIAWGVKNAGNVVAYFGAKAGLLRKTQMLELTKLKN